MLLRFPIFPPYFPLQRYLRSTSSSYSQVPLGFGSSALSLWADQKSGGPIRCSVSQVHSYGTVDPERPPALKWSSLARRISAMENPSLGCAAVLERWEEEERRLHKWELCRVVKELRKFRRFKLALEVCDWMTAQGDRFMFTSSDMAIQLDLIAKAHGISRAEEHFSQLPDTLKDKRTYGALLNVYGRAKMKEKAEAIVEVMRNKGYLTEALIFNVMMTLYMNVGEHEQVSKIINEMKENNISFDIYSYNIWITNCATMGDAEEMERVVGLMSSDNGINANWTPYTTLATMYIRLGNFEKAQSCLKDAEIRVMGRDRTPFNYLIGLYGSIGKREEVYRIWNWYKSSFPRILNVGYQCMLSSLIRLGDVDGAEMIYEEWLSMTSSYDPRICNILLGLYAREGLASKAKNALDKFLEKGGKPRPIMWETLAEGYIKEEQISEALSYMREAVSYEGVNNWRPKPKNIENLLALCKGQNDISSINMLMDMLRMRGCHEKEEYKSLISAYCQGN
ncbi:pentatricopeptide repeat-containing protein At1g02150 [Elaeis guineensis]|uniref:Pentatricopeptide repeat-containing protein At1g02150 n=1 Tax=Elaeis guineensis var. tenera TaxID=51953 RepID=A0A6I9RWH9_ELAGV|nr:pentatricopeptide repeat-containing protein At1g02150 [Elaeis guineensis]